MEPLNGHNSAEQREEPVQQETSEEGCLEHGDSVSTSCPSSSENPASPSRSSPCTSPEGSPGGPGTSASDSPPNTNSPALSCYISLPDRTREPAQVGKRLKDFQTEKNGLYCVRGFVGTLAAVTRRGGRYVTDDNSVFETGRQYMLIPEDGFGEEAGEDPSKTSTPWAETLAAPLRLAFGGWKRVGADDMGDGEKKIKGE